MLNILHYNKIISNIYLLSSSKDTLEKGEIAKLNKILASFFTEMQ
jgi:hypothetical protein